MTRTLGTRVLGAVALVGGALVWLLGLVVSPDDVVQGDAVRLLYVHVPTIWVAYLAFVTTSVASALYLWPRTRARRWDRIAGTGGEIGTLFLALSVVGGALWGRITWGVYWRWDARNTTTALLLVMYLGYLAVRRVPADPVTRSKRSAIAALIAFVNVPIVHFSVEWWRTLHQQASILRPDPEFEITGDMLATLFFSLAVFTAAALWLGIHRYRLIRLEELDEAEGLSTAIEERRAEALV